MIAFTNILSAECDRYGLIPDYVRAIIEVESGGVPWRTRYEPGWNYFEAPEYWANKLGESVDTEMVGQKFSYGPMQVMGGTARHCGFSGYFPELCTASIGIHFGCLLFSQKLTKYNGAYLDAIAAYNAGSVTKLGEFYSNQSYVDKVLLAYKRLKISG